MRQRSEAVSLPGRGPEVQRFGCSFLCTFLTFRCLIGVDGFDAGREVTVATVTQLRDRAKELGLKGYSKLSKEQLEVLLAQIEPEGRKPRATQAAAWTPEKREKMRRTMLEYYKKHDGPMKGRKLSEETKEKIRDIALNREVKGNCIVCGRPLSDDHSVVEGIGPLCKAKMEDNDE